MVPSGWKLKHLSELTTKISDGIHSTPKYSHYSAIPFINGNNLKNGQITVQSTTKFVDEEDALNHKRELGDRTLLMSINGTIGNLAFYRNENVVLGKSACYLNVIEAADKDFIYYFLGSSKTQAFFESELTGTTIRNLSLKSIKATKVPTPPLPEQNKIAEILSTWDKAITATEQLLANSQQQKKALMQQLLTGKKRLLDDSGQVFTGELIKCNIGKLLKESRTPSISNNPDNRLTVRLNLKGIEKREFRGTESIDATAHFVRKSGQFIYGKQNIHKGSFGIIPNEFDGFETSQDLPAFDFTGTCESSWFFYYVSQNWFYQSLENRMSGTGSKRLSPTEFFKVSVLLPELIEQQKIAAVLTSADQEIDTLKQKLDHIKQEKKALMQQLLTGKRRVKLEAA